jgi:hypothetical protein
MIRALAVVASLSAALVLAACGGDSSDGFSVELAGGAPTKAGKGIATCLDEVGFDALPMPTKGTGGDPPDFAVGFQRGTDLSGGGEIAFYETPAEADERVTAIEENSDSFDGEVDQHGSATVVYFSDPSDEIRDDVRGCIDDAG